MVGNAHNCSHKILSGVWTSISFGVFIEKFAVCILKAAFILSHAGCDGWSLFISPLCAVLFFAEIFPQFLKRSGHSSSSPTLPRFLTSVVIRRAEKAVRAPQRWRAGSKSHVTSHRPCATHHPVNTAALYQQICASLFCEFIPGYREQEANFDPSYYRHSSVSLIKRPVTVWFVQMRLKVSSTQHLSVRKKMRFVSLIFTLHRSGSLWASGWRRQLEEQEVSSQQPREH